MKKIKKYNEFNIGDIIVIEKCPCRWNSDLNQNNPITSKIKFPYTTKIIEISEDNMKFVAMTDGYYGWSLSCLIEQNLIMLKSEARRKKLEKLNKI